jgi:hypothetical protein
MFGLVESFEFVVCVLPDDQPVDAKQMEIRKSDKRTKESTRTSIANHLVTKTNLCARELTSTSTSRPLVFCAPTHAFLIWSCRMRPHDTIFPFSLPPGTHGSSKKIPPLLYRRTGSIVVARSAVQRSRKQSVVDRSAVQRSRTNTRKPFRQSLLT